jgi:hypothetical protein
MQTGKPLYFLVLQSAAIILMLGLISCTMKWEDENPVAHPSSGNLFINVVSPAPDDTVTGTINIRIQVFDDQNDIKSVQLFLDGNFIKSWQKPPYELRLNPIYEDSSAHNFYIIAIDGDGNRIQSDTYKFVFRKEADLLTRLKFSSPDKDTVLLTWNDSYNDETGYVLEEKTWYSASNSTPHYQKAFLPADASAYILTGLDTTRAYSYRVKPVKNNTSYPYSNEIKIFYGGFSDFGLKNSFGDQLYEIRFLRKWDMVLGWGASHSVKQFDIDGNLIKEYFSVSMTDALTASADEELIAVSAGNFLNIWKVVDGTLVKNINTGSSHNLIVLSPNKKYIAGASGTNVNIWEISNGALVRQFSNNSNITAMTISNDGSTLITGDRNDIKFWNFSSGSLTKTIEVNGNYSIVSLEMNKAGTEIASAGYHLKLWNYPEGTEKMTLGSGSETFLKYNEDGSRLMVNSGALLNIWDMTTYLLLESLTVNVNLLSGAFGPANNTIFTAGDKIRHWEKYSGWTEE